MTTATPVYAPTEQSEIIRLAQLVLTSLFAGRAIAELEADADRLGLPPAERVNVTLRCGPNLRGSMSARGSNLGRQVVRAVLAAALDRRFGGPLTRWELPQIRLEIWIQTGSSEISPAARSEENPILLGIEGVEIEGRGKSAYFKPSVPITSRKKTARDLFPALCKKAGLEKDAWQASDVSLRRTQWVYLSSIDSRPISPGVSPWAQESRHPRAAGNPPDVDPRLRGGDDETFIDSWIAESVAYLIRNQHISGNAAYLYDPIADVVERERINLVRAAGCVYALSQVLQHGHLCRSADGQAETMKTIPLLAKEGSGAVDRLPTTPCPSSTEEGSHFQGGRHAALEGSLYIGATQMARSLLNRTTLNSDGGRVVREAKASEPPKLGATALLAAALSAGILHEQYAEEYRQLYRAILSAQKPDGCFVTRFGSAEESEREVNYFSGEALLVLALEAERGNAEALERCRRAFPPYVLHFRQAPATAFVGWHVDVWSRIAVLTGEHSYADFAFEQTDWLLQMQVEDHPDWRWIGGFSDSGAAPRCSSIVFLEATARALALALKTVDIERTRKYAEAVRRGLQFCRRLRLEETAQSLLGNPARCQGGLALGLLDRRVRCDVVQHFITLCLALEPVMALIT